MLVYIREHAERLFLDALASRMQCQGVQPSNVAYLGGPLPTKSRTDRADG